MEILSAGCILIQVAILGGLALLSIWLHFRERKQSRLHEATLSTSINCPNKVIRLRVHQLKIVDQVGAKTLKHY